MKKTKTISALKNLLLKSKKRIAKMQRDSNCVVIFGAGNTSNLYKKCFETENIVPVCFLDNFINYTNNRGV